MLTVRRWTRHAPRAPCLRVKPPMQPRGWPRLVHFFTRSLSHVFFSRYTPCFHLPSTLLLLLFLFLFYRSVRYVRPHLHTRPHLAFALTLGSPIACAAPCRRWRLQQARGCGTPRSPSRFDRRGWSPTLTACRCVSARDSGRPLGASSWALRSSSTRCGFASGHVSLVFLRTVLTKGLSDIVSLAIRWLILCDSVRVFVGLGSVAVGSRVAYHLRRALMLRVSSMLRSPHARLAQV